MRGNISKSNQAPRKYKIKMEPHSKSYKVLLVGDGGVGKTSYVRRMGTGRYTSKYNSTIGVEIHPLEIPTVNGDVILDMWDTAG